MNFFINQCIINTESNEKFKKINIKDHIFFCFDDKSKIEDFDLDNILIDEESDENILVHNIS